MRVCVCVCAHMHIHTLLNQLNSFISTFFVEGGSVHLTLHSLSSATQLLETLSSSSAAMLGSEVKKLLEGKLAVF